MHTDTKGYTTHSRESNGDRVDCTMLMGGQRSHLIKVLTTGKKEPLKSKEKYQEQSLGWWCTLLFTKVCPSQLMFDFLTEN